MRIYWVDHCQQYPRPNYWEPLMESVRRQFSPMFPASWSIAADLARSTKWCVGVAEVNTAQLAAVQGTTAIIVFDETLLFSTFQSLPGAARNNINAFTDSIGMARAQNSEVLHDLWNRISTGTDFKPLDALIVELQAEIDRTA